MSYSTRGWGGKPAKISLQKVKASLGSQDNLSWWRSQGARLEAVVQTVSAARRQTSWIDMPCTQDANPKPKP